MQLAPLFLGSPCAGKKSRNPAMGAVHRESHLLHEFPFLALLLYLFPSLNYTFIWRSLIPFWLATFNPFLYCSKTNVLDEEFLHCPHSDQRASAPHTLAVRSRRPLVDVVFLFPFGDCMSVGCTFVRRSHMASLLAYCRRQWCLLLHCIVAHVKLRCVPVKHG